MVEGEAIFSLLLEEVQHGLIHMAGAQTPPKGYHNRPPVVKAQLLPRLLRRFGEEVAPHRGAGDHDALRVAVVLPAVLKPHHDDVCEILQHLGGQAGHRIAFMHRRGNVGQRRRPYHGEAGVAAGTHHQIGLELPQDGLGGLPRANQRTYCVEVVAHRLRLHGAAEAADLYGGVVVACLGRQLPFHAVGRTHEQHGGLGIALPHKPRQRQRRIDVSRGASAGENDSHCKLLLLFLYTFRNFLTKRYGLLSDFAVAARYPALGAGICRDTLSTMPISTSCKHSAVPP